MGIMHYINMEANEYYAKLDRATDKDREYIQASKEFENLIEMLDKETWMDFECKVNSLMNIAKEISYDEGFKEGVKFVVNMLMDSH